VTLSVRNNEIVRGNNRDSSGINGEFLCIKGRYAYDFTHHAERITKPHIPSQRRTCRMYHGPKRSRQPQPD